jgi:NADPH:quinone reductase-like Zn-dependent oxidoreductase
MKAVRYHQYGDPSVLRHEEAPRPVPGPGQVLVRVAATSYNSVDAAIRAGYLQQVFPLRLPHTPGLDLSGTVEEIGDGVSDLQAGDPVIGFLPMGETAPPLISYWRLRACSPRHRRASRCLRRRRCRRWA